MRARLQGKNQSELKGFPLECKTSEGTLRTDLSLPDFYLLALVFNMQIFKERG